MQKNQLASLELEKLIGNTILSKNSMQYYNN
jgi:hypothetical protein